MKLKNLTVDVKASPEPGQFTAYASVFGNRDSYGDIVVKGAFDATLKEWAASDNAIPLLYGHRMDDPDYNLGWIVSAEEDEHGLKVVAQLDLENPKAEQVYRMMKGHRINQMSFAYDVLDGAPAVVDGEESYLLRALKLYEVSVVPLGANQETEILAVKAAASALAYEVHAGCVLEGKSVDILRAAQVTLDGLIRAAEGNDQEKASGTHLPEADASEGPPDGATPETVAAEAAVNPSVDTFLAVISTQERI